MNSVAVNIYVQIFGWTVISFLLSVYLGVELQSHMASLCLTFWRTARLLSKETAPFYILTRDVWGFPGLHEITNNC
jgi:hypothetical protein